MAKERYARDLLLRIIAAFAVGLVYNLLYAIIAPLTLHWSYFFFSIFVPSALIGNSIQTLTNNFNFIPACVATSAYVLLAMLILLTKDINWNERLQMFVFGSLAILAFNIIRIELLLLTYFRLESAYDSVHLFVWKFMSTAFVVILWLVLARTYKVKAIPVYSDIKYIIGMIRKRR
ncbi:MAG: pacearchaeosortase [Nanoarchaeota archaeon]|nr:pacearchaeosortase [Nanoarchaeota archaeon]